MSATMQVVPTIATHNGTVTVYNPATQGHRTFRVKSQPDDAAFAPGERVLGLLTGSDNERDYTQFAFVKEDGRVIVWKKFRGGVYDRFADMLRRPEAYESRGVEYTWDQVRCRKCNRKLTTPESLADGIGPDCSGRAARARQDEVEDQTPDEEPTATYHFDRFTFDARARRYSAAASELGLRAGVSPPACFELEVAGGKHAFRRSTVDVRAGEVLGWNYRQVGGSEAVLIIND